MGCGSSKQANGVQEDAGSTKTQNPGNLIVANNAGPSLPSTTPATATAIVTDHHPLSANSSSLLISPSESLTHTQESYEDILWKLDEEEISTQNTHKTLERIKETACNEFSFSGKGVLKGRVSIFDTKKGWFSTPTGAFSPGNFMEGSVPKLQYDKFQKSQDNSVLTYTDMRETEFADRPAVKHRPHMTFRSGLLLISKLAKQPHPMGYLFVWDSKPGRELTPHQISRFEQLAEEAVTALQKSLLKAIEASTPSDSSDTLELPAVWVDINTKDWKILGINKQWEQLTGVGLDTLLKSKIGDHSGLLRIMGPADGSSTSELRHAIKSAAADVAPECSIPAIISPRSPAGASLQFAVAVKRATHPPPIPVVATNTTNETTDMWMVEVHVRVQGDTHDPDQCPHDAPESVRLSWQSAGSGGSGSGYYQIAHPQQFGGAIVRGSNNSTGGHSSGGFRGPSSDYGTRVPGKAISLSIANDILSGIPPRLANLRFGEILGSGSHADAYSGYLGSRPVAIKVIEIPDTRKTKKDWGAHYEALLAVDIKHPNVITTYDWSRIEEPRGWQVWIVQEKCDRGSLSETLESGEFRIGNDPHAGPNMPVILETMREVARGMRYLHSIGEIHADLSANNVLLTSAENERGFVAKVTDFGLAKLATSKHITKTFGTVTYMPPEVLLEGVVSIAGDVYAFGVMFWEMVCAKRAWAGLSTTQVMFAVSCREQKLEMPASSDGDGEGKVPKEVVVILEKCMATDPNERPSFEELCTELDALIAKLYNQ